VGGGLIGHYVSPNRGERSTPLLAEYGEARVGRINDL